MHKLSEAFLHSADVGAIFKSAADYKNAPKGLGKIFKNFRKDKISPNDLIQAWNEAGRPLSLNKIKDILTKFGYNDKDINSIFSNLFGKPTNDNEPYESPRQSATIMKIAQYAKKNNIDKEIIEYLKTNYGFGSVEENFIVDDSGIDRIFEEAVLLSTKIRTIDRKILDIENLGRSKK